MLEPEVGAKTVNLRRGTSLRIPSMSDPTEESELGRCRSGSLKILRSSDVVARERAPLTNAGSSPSSASSSSSSSSVASSDRCASCSINRSFRSARRHAPAGNAPAPEYLARSLLQLGCPAVSMPTHLSKPLSRSTPSMAAGGAQTPAKVSRSSSRSSPTSTSSARQKKFHRHFSQVADDEHVLNYYSCALVGDILLQGHLYITPNYFAFYSNVFGYVTKLLIPTASVLKISKEKTARIIPNAVAVTTEEERHVFCSLLSRDSTYKLMKQVWDAALEPRATPNALPALDNDTKLLAPDALLVDDSEVNAAEDESSMSESGTDITATTSSRPATVVDSTDVSTVALNRPNLPPARFETMVLTKTLMPNRSSRLRFLFANGLRPRMVIAILVGLLAILYVSAALMMMRIDRLHTAYLNHPLVSPERFTQDRLLHYLNTNLDQIVKVRQSLQTLSKKFVTMSQDGSQTGPAGGVVEPEDAPS
ncbi:hypothetical protein ACFW04_008911 [Cataglyphis niger]